MGDVDVALGADLIHRAFDDYHQRFRAVTRRARERFERRAWGSIRRDTVERLNLHGRCIDDCIDTLREELGERLDQRELWSDLKAAYTYEILGRDDFEIAQTFFNSLVRKTFPHVGVDPAIDFVAEDFPLPYRSWEMASARTYAVRRVSDQAIEKILASTDVAVPFRDLVADARRAGERIRSAIEEFFGSQEVEAIDVLRPVFVRNKAAYIVGRVRRGSQVMPLLLSVLNHDDGLEIDAVLHRGEQISVVFSFARWYFHADVENPRAVIGFLHSILPRKRVAELYISLGYNKHGKTELYNDLMTTIANTDEQFIIAPGKKGLVMSVFTLPSYEFVFKVIRDVFPKQKSVTPDEVRARYREVLQHDRVGRLVDFQEFEHLEFPISLFSSDLLQELTETAAGAIDSDGDQIIIRHLYVGRRVTPLDLYLRDATPEEADAAVIDWGFALKDLAAANIFAGDMLLKNFGVTRHGRVVFYDYDEISPVTDCRFRKIPPPRSDWDELAPGPWFSVAQEDVFPEELRSFTLLNQHLETVFDTFHSDLFGVEFWKSMQERNRSGEVIEFFPYDDHSRLRPALAGEQPDATREN